MYLEWFNHYWACCCVLLIFLSEGTILPKNACFFSLHKFPKFPKFKLLSMENELKYWSTFFFVESEIYSGMQKTAPYSISMTSIFVQCPPFRPLWTNLNCYVSTFGILPYSCLNKEYAFIGWKDHRDCFYCTCNISWYVWIGDLQTSPVFGFFCPLSVFYACIVLFLIFLSVFYACIILFLIFLSVFYACIVLFLIFFAWIMLWSVDC